MSEDRQDQDTGATRRVPINLGLLHPIGTPQVTPVHALAPGAQSLGSLMIQPPRQDSLFPAESGQQYLSQGPIGSPTVPVGQSIDPSLASVPGTGAHAAYQANLERAANVALSFGPGQFRAYHGTGATPFEQFLDEFIGTGEGAQAFSWGHYVAQKPGVAGTYMPRGPDVPLDERGSPLGYTDVARKFYEPGSIVKSYGGYDRVLKFNEPEGDYGWSVNVQSVHPDNARARAEGINPQTAQGWDEIQRRPDLWNDSQYDRPRSHATYPTPAEIQRAGQLRGWDMGQPGSMLNVWVKPDHEEFLDWDLPLNQQEPGVEQKLEKEYGTVPPSLTGKDLYNNLVSKYTPDNMYDESRMLASKELDRIGIPGMRFLDQQSRGLPEGHPNRTYNYVVYDPKNIEITHRDGQRVHTLEPVDHDPWAEQKAVP